MKSLRDMPLQQKMLVMTLSICGAVLCIAIAALFTFQVLNFRSTFQRDAATLSAIIANNVNGALDFRDDKAANEFMASMKAKPGIVSATLCLPDGSVFAQYGKQEGSAEFAQFPQAGEQRFSHGDLLLTQPVNWKNERAGTLFVRLDYRHTLFALLRFYVQVIMGIILVSISLAWFLSNRLGRTITAPIIQLAQTAQIVGKTKDYNLRALVDRRSDELGVLALSFNHMLGRIQTQDAALSLSQQKLEALIHSIDGIVWERTTETFQFTFVSRQSEEILGYSPQAWLQHPNFWNQKLDPQDAEMTVETVHRMVSKGQSYICEYRIAAADGRTVWIRESGTVLVEQGKPTVVRGILQDITRQKLDAEQLDKLNRLLIDTSRSAGMADIATGVLHNVGNVLNSVSVSATSVGDRLRSSKVTKLSRATAMLREQNGHLAEFLTSDPKGKLIPEFLISVADELVGEQNELMAKMATVGEHIEHIKEIVAMQQSYARVTGVYENLAASDLVEDALRINASAFDRHHIHLVRDFEQNTPRVRVDRHKVLQILINLLRNAKHAMEEQSGGDKQLVVRVTASAPEMVKIIVTDTGVGIPPENMTKIFNYGFTTKKEGHGFGLHSGANAAKEMGGNLSASSEGPGKGAQFTLELPVAVLAPTAKEATQVQS